MSSFSRKPKLICDLRPFSYKSISEVGHWRQRGGLECSLHSNSVPKVLRSGFCAGHFFHTNLNTPCIYKPLFVHSGTVMLELVWAGLLQWMEFLLLQQTKTFYKDNSLGKAHTYGCDGPVSTYFWSCSVFLLLLHFSSRNAWRSCSQCSVLFKNILQF